MTTRLSGPEIPVPGAERFSAQLFKACGCRLAWHRLRKVFVVYRQRGKYQPLQSYCDIGNEHYPFRPELLDETVRVVRWADASMSGDFDRMLEEYKRIERDESQAETDRLMNDFWPEYRKDLIRFGEMLYGGRTAEKYFQVTAP